MGMTFGHLKKMGGAVMRFGHLKLPVLASYRPLVYIICFSVMKEQSWTGVGQNWFQQKRV